MSHTRCPNYNEYECGCKTIEDTIEEQKKLKCKHGVNIKLFNFNHMSEKEIKKPIINKDVILNTLNQMNEYASSYVVDEMTDNSGRIELQENYDLLVNFISNLKDSNFKERKGNQGITVPVSEEDIQELQNGEEFTWVLRTNLGENIDVLLRQELEEDLED